MITGLIFIKPATFYTNYYSCNIYKPATFYQPAANIYKTCHLLPTRKLINNLHWPDLEQIPGAGNTTPPPPPRAQKAARAIFLINTL